MLMLLARYWYIFAIAGLLAALGGQHWYYKNKVTGLENDVTTLTLSIKAANIKEKALEVAAVDLTKKYKESLHNQFELQAEQGRKAAERIKNDKESKRIILSANIISLFNESKPSTKGQATTPTIRLNAGGAAATTTPSTPIEEATITLNDLLLISASNDKEHLKCIDQVHEWQHFWTDVEQSVKALESP